MKKLYISIAIILSVSLLTTSCNSFLDEDSREKVEAKDQEVYSPEEILTGVYGMFDSWDYSFSFLGVTEIISDNADKGSSPSDTGTDKHELDGLTFTTTCGSVRAMWKYWYTSIGRATQSIEYTQNYGLTDASYRDRMIGEAKFLRALNYFYLVRGWGAVPIQEQDLTLRADVDVVYDYIEADLIDAAATLPLRSGYASRDMGRATKGAAQALLAKVHLYQKDWQKAYNYADTVINSNEYNLMSSYLDAFKSDAAYHNGSESIFEFQAKDATNGIAHGIQQYSQTQGARGTTGWGWGFNTPSQNLLDAFNAAGDTQRRDATIIFRNSVLYDGRVVGSTENAMYNYKAYSSSDPGGSQNDRFVPYLRYAELLLIKAEAANELGLTTDALAALNQVRNRAGLSSLTITAQAALRQAIWDERRLELAMEHDRWFDLVRTGQGATAMAADGKTFVVGKHEYFPVPNEQLLQTPELGQNPNW
ncbi:RagB/SusD family nutrient uptake outer membrane protein [Dysgonomonas sp. 25]|uniref:RagB/SusD family nutrient uptake outer membrane protein n=1 Tax=Dysgonomonas sp. 25 TaxID=2302933 RepID=UPI0013D7C352|nr:RagB/SusD family nutrient uptake outer membrane protein [Dysgonomonas sp. 25]NDV69318.1 RagB/SusD family nutrient uptake outer membrane protein [Dysgonomonas sp. 25]